MLEQQKGFVRRRVRVAVPERDVANSRDFMTAPSTLDLDRVLGEDPAPESTADFAHQIGRRRPTPRAGPLCATLVSNSRLLIDALPGLLAPHLALRLVATCSGTSRLAEAGPNPAGHVVVIDAGIGIEATVRWTRYWRRLVPPADVVAIEVGEDTNTILTYIEAGVGGYTLQGATAADVAQALRWVQEGRANCTPLVAAELFARFAAAAPAPAPLTARELEVLRCINQDLSNQEIATSLVIEVHTVKHHVHSILHKLKLSHRWEAARMATERGWLSVNPDRQ